MNNTLLIWSASLFLLLSLPAEAVRAQPSDEGPGGEAEAGTEVEVEVRTTSTHADDQAARILFQTAREAFETGDYQTALDRFTQAYELSGRSALLYNIGTTLDRLRRDEEALDAFNRYLEAEPNSPNRAEIEARIAQLEQVIADREAHQAAQSERQAELEREQLESQRRQELEEARPPIPLWAFLTAGGVTVALGAGAVGMGVATNNRNDDFEQYLANNPSPTDVEREEARRLYDDAEGAQKVTNALGFTAMGLAIGTGIIAIWTDFGGEPDLEDGEVALTPQLAVDRQGATIGLTRSF